MEWFIGSRFFAPFVMIATAVIMLFALAGAAAAQQVYRLPTTDGRVDVLARSPAVARDGQGRAVSLAPRSMQVRLYDAVTGDEVGPIGCFFVQADELVLIRGLYVPPGMRARVVAFAENGCTGSSSLPSQNAVEPEFGVSVPSIPDPAGAQEPDRTHDAEP